MTFLQDRGKTYLRPLQRVDEPALSDVGVPYDTDGDTLRAGLVRLSRRIRPGAVDEDRFVRWLWFADLSGSVGVECRMYRSHAWAFSRGMRSVE